MKRLFPTVIYLFAAAWLILASAARLAIMFNKGYDIDPLPFISVIIAIAILAAVLAQRKEKDKP